PYLLPKLRYDKVGWMAERGAMPAHDQSKALDTPESPAHPWAEHRGFGVDPDARTEFAGDGGEHKNFGPAPAKTHADPPASAAPPTMTEEQPAPRLSLPVAAAPVPSAPSLSAVRASWDTGRPSRRKADPAQTSFDFDAPAPADVPPANEAEPATTGELDLLDRLHGGSL
ncbi:MAG: hypothetical protein MUC44_15760, partial [Beijerinckiaceae bacterium]|nr:hypothetical protein [Beijerinckiaceae bacterium]